MTVPSNLGRMQRFINDFRALRQAQRQARLREMETFLSVFGDAYRCISHGRVDFNVFALLGVDTDEIKHSSFLAWLLDARAGHGQGDIFLKAFARACGLPIVLAAPHRYRVRTEFSGSESIVDILVCRRGDFLVYLENKVFAPEGPDQVDREFRDMCRLASSLRVPEGRRFAIFLTPDGRRPLSGDPTRWKAVSYGQIAQQFAGILPDIRSDKLRLVVRDWIETVSGFGR